MSPFAVVVLPGYVLFVRSTRKLEVTINESHRLREFDASGN
jgi:hypothetical protein